MEFRKMVTITLYTRQQKRQWCIEQSFRLCEKGRGWDDLGEWHWNMYNIVYEMSRQSRFNARYWMLGAGALGRPRGMVWGGRREEGSGWGTRVCLWWIHFDIWQNQYNIVKFKNKINLKKKKKKPEHQRISTFELWCQRRLFRVPWTAKRSNQSILKETSPEYSLEGLMLKPKLQYNTWPSDGKNQLIGKDPDTGKDWRQEEKQMPEDEMVGWHHWHDGYEFEQALGVGDGQGILACYSPWGRKELDMAELLNWTELMET